MKDLRNNEDALVAHLENNYLSVDYLLAIDKPSIKVQKAMITSNHDYFKYLAPNASKSVRLEAVKIDGLLIKYIKDPTNSEIKAALKSNFNALSLIKKPTLEYRKIALKTSGFAVKYINKPTDEERLLAIKTNGRAIMFLKNLTDDEYLMAVKSDPLAIEFVPRENRTKAMTDIIVKKLSCYVSYVSHLLTKSDLRFILHNKPFLLELLDITFPDDFQVEAVKHDPYTYRCFKNPCKEAQIMAAKYNADLLIDTKNICREAKLEAIKTYRSVRILSNDYIKIGCTVFHYDQINKNICKNKLDRKLFKTFKEELDKILGKNEESRNVSK